MYKNPCSGPTMLHHAGFPGGVLKRDPDEHEYQQADADDVGHDPVANQGGPLGGVQWSFYWRFVLVGGVERGEVAVVCGELRVLARSRSAWSSAGAEPGSAASLGVAFSSGASLRVTDSGSGWLLVDEPPPQIDAVAGEKRPLEHVGPAQRVAGERAVQLPPPECETAGYDDERRQVQANRPPREPRGTHLDQVSSPRIPACGRRRRLDFRAHARIF